MSSGGGGSPAVPSGGNMAGFGAGLLPGLILSKIFSGQGIPAGGLPTFGGGMFGNPGVANPFFPGSQPQPGPPGQYTASPAAQAQINSLLSGTAGVSMPGATGSPNPTVAPGAWPPDSVLGRLIAARGGL